MEIKQPQAQIDAMQYKPKQVVIVGAGFGGLSAARELQNKNVEITIIDRNNYHLFQPLLYQVAGAALSPNDIAFPIRGLFRQRKNVRVIMDEVTAIDVAQKRVQTRQTVTPYDYLILAPGSEYSYFNKPEWQNVTLGLKTLEDAVLIRQKILRALEQAELEQDEAKRDLLMTFVLVGGGPTGVEMAGVIAELVKIAAAEEYRALNPRKTRILLIEAGPRILAQFPEDLSDAAHRSLQEKGVEVYTDTRVEDITIEGVIANGVFIPSPVIVWSAGVKARPVAKWLGHQVKTGGGGRVKVLDDLSVPGHPEIFVIGDAAEVLSEERQPLPGLAPVAKQEGEFVARFITDRLRGQIKPKRFRYRDLGTMATIGRYSAIADFGWLKLKGWFAWVLWGIVHVFYLIGVRNRIMVLLNWFWEYLTFRRNSRIIVTTETTKS